MDVPRRVTVQVMMVQINDKIVFSGLRQVTDVYQDSYLISQTDPSLVFVSVLEAVHKLCNDCNQVSLETIIIT